MQNRTGRTGTAQLVRQDWAGTTEQLKLGKLPEQGCQDKTARAGKPGEDRKLRKERTARTGQLGQDRQNKTAMTGLPGQNGQDRAARRRLPVQHC
jgi:hypothetical protein